MMARKRFRSGDVCERTDAYRFDGYVVSAAAELPRLGELETIVEAGQSFPRVASTQLDCWWMPSTEAEADSAALSTPNLTQLPIGV